MSKEKDRDKEKDQTAAMRAQALESTLEALEKRWGKGAVMRLGESQAIDVEVISTGSLALDQAVGIGGYPRGRVIEVYGPESSGKTTLALHAIAAVQKRGGTAAFVDAEHALDISYARKLGVDVDQLLVSQPDHGEQALEIAEALLRSGAIDLVVIDSVAALVPQAELEGEMGDQHMGLQARLMSQALRKITACTSRSHAIVMFINQVRQKIGVTFGNGETTTGGNALKFYASIRLEIRRIGAVKRGEDVIGSRTKIKVVKNRIARVSGGRQSGVRSRGSGRSSVPGCSGVPRSVPGFGHTGHNKIRRAVILATIFHARCHAIHSTEKWASPRHR